MSSTIFIALCMVGAIALIVGLLMLVHKRDKKRQGPEETIIP
jgi:hypothetical protein